LEDCQTFKIEANIFFATYFATSLLEDLLNIQIGTNFFHNQLGKFAEHSTQNKKKIFCNNLGRLLTHSNHNKKIFCNKLGVHGGACSNAQIQRLRFLIEILSRDSSVVLAWQSHARE
jgi:hypothetical protein